MPHQIVLIMTDSQRFDMVGAYGNPDMHTPNIDRICQEGLRFDRAYTTQPVCGPARSAIFTGLFPHSNGAVTNCVAMGANVKTVGQRLKDNGFHTAYIGKWHLDGGDYFGLGRCPDGWDSEYWYDMRNYLDELTPEERVLSRTPGTPVESEFCFGHRVTDRAIRFLEQAARAEEDCFLAVSYDEPHDPGLCPEPYRSMYESYELPRRPNLWDTLEGKPEYQRVWAGDYLDTNPDDIRLTAPSFFGSNAYIDSQIGRVLDAIDRHMPDALVIYTSDHGDGMRSHGLFAKGPTAYEEIARIPLAVRWKGRIAPDVCALPVSHIQLTPTILDAAGLPPAKWCDGATMLPLLLDPKAHEVQPVFLEFSRYEIDHDGFGGYQPMRCVFDGRYKLSVHLLSSDELYDLEEDPYEMHNLIESDSHADVRNRLHDRLLRWMNETRDPERGYYWERRTWRKDAAPASWDYTRMTRQRENEEYEPRQLDYRTGLAITEATRLK